MVNYLESNWESISALISDYLAVLNGKNDAFHHDLLFGGIPYLIQENGRDIGFFSLSDGWDDGKMLCGMYLPQRGDSAQIFTQMLEKFDIRSALVPSNDSLLVALTMEFVGLHGGSFVVQAYQYTYGLPERPAEYDLEDIAPVEPDEYEEMNRLTEGQWDGCYDDLRFRFYVLRHDGVTLGYGATCPLPYQENYIDIGNFTLPQQRLRGVGRSILIGLAQMAVSHGMIPIAGCWAGNKESIPTIRSAGFIPENRIFYVKFK